MPLKPEFGQAASRLLTFQDMDGMSGFRRGGRWGRWQVPAFANNMPQVRQVLMYRAWAFLHAHTPMPTGLDWKHLDQLCTVRVRYLHDTNPTCGRAAIWRAVDRAGTYMSLQGLLINRCWRVQESLPEVSRDLGLPIGQLHHQLELIARAAERLGFETYPHVKPAGPRISTAEKIRQGWTPAVRAAKAAAVRLQWADPAKRARIRAAMRATWARKRAEGTLTPSQVPSAPMAATSAAF